MVGIRRMVEKTKREEGMIIRRTSMNPLVMVNT
jgi:hypothetical protein